MKPFELHPVNTKKQQWLFRVVLALCVCFYFVGQLGHSPWRGDDAYYYQWVKRILDEGWNLFNIPIVNTHRSITSLALWPQVLTATLFSKWLPLWDSARLASAFLGIVYVSCMVIATKNWFGKHKAVFGLIFAISPLGLLVESHEIQPLLLGLSGIALWLLGLSRFKTGKELAAIGLLFLGLSVLSLYPYFIFELGCGLVSIWYLFRQETNVFKRLAVYLLITWFAARVFFVQSVVMMGYQFDVNAAASLIWGAFPLWPLAILALWRVSGGRVPATENLIVVVMGLLVAIFTLFLEQGHSSSKVLLILPFMSLLAVSQVDYLRRGVENAVKWFSIVLFSTASLFVWVAWGARNFGWPPGLARHFVRFGSGFIPSVDIAAVIIAVSAMLAMLALFYYDVRHKAGGWLSWVSGLVLLWVVLVQLHLPWFDHLKSATKGLGVSA